MTTIELSSAFELILYEARVGDRAGVGLRLECTTASSRGDSGHRGSFIIPKAKAFELINALAAFAEAPTHDEWGVEAEAFRRTP